jgi:DNA-binding transcriptional MerR regulator
VRHYERLGLVPAASRTSAGYRQYPEFVCRRVLVVRAALALGFKLRELVTVFGIRERGGSPCQEVRRLARKRLVRLDDEIRELLQTRRRLKSVLKDWDERFARVTPGSRAHLLESLVRED